MKGRVAFMASVVAVLLTIAPCATAMASDSVISQADEIIINMLLDERAESLSLDDQDKVHQIDRQLVELGAEILTPEEAAKVFERDSGGIGTYVATPASSSVQWVSTRVNYVYGGQAYEIQTLIAQPKNNSSILSQMGSRSLSSTYQWLAGVMNALQVVGSAAVGAAVEKIPGSSIALTVYDTVSAFISGISKTTDISSASIVYSYSHKTTASFKFVKKKGQSDNSQFLSYVSTNGVTAVGYQYPTLTYNGFSKPNIVQGQRTVSSTPNGYNSNANAAKAYATTGRMDRLCVSSVTITGIESKSVSKISTPCFAGMGQVY